MLMSHFICQTVRNTIFRLYSRPSSVTDGKQRDRNHPFSLLQCRQVDRFLDLRMITLPRTSLYHSSVKVQSITDEMGGA
jgi:hypothetical protein